MNHARVLLHSVSPEGKEICTFEIELPRCVLAESSTHRANYDCWSEAIYDRTTTEDLSKSSASSRAIPLHRMLQKVMTDPYVPERFSAAGPGMQAAGWLEGADHDLNVKNWLEAREAAVLKAICSQNAKDREELFARVPKVGHLRWFVARHVAPSVSLHKQDVNRLVEPWGWVKQVITATEWDNFFALRCDEAAAPAIRTIARLMFLAKRASRPKRLDYGEWHLPYVTAAESAEWGERARDLSAARCAWTSHWPPEGNEGDQSAKVTRTLGKLFDSMPVHSSPAEHQAKPMRPGDELREDYRSNLRHWVQYRCLIRNHTTHRYAPDQAVIDGWGVTPAQLEAAQAPF